MGHHVECFDYLAFAGSVEAIVSRLADRLKAIDDRGNPFRAMGHSLGGLLLRLALDRANPVHLESLIMAGTPNRSPRLARMAVRVPPFRWMAGDAGRRLADPGWYASLPSPRVRYLIIAGTRGPTGPLSPFGDDPNDGIVSVSETLIDSRDRLIEVPAFHTFLMNHPRVREMICGREE